MQLIMVGGWYGGRIVWPPYRLAGFVAGVILPAVAAPGYQDWITAPWVAVRGSILPRTIRPGDSRIVRAGIP